MYFRKESMALREEVYRYIARYISEHVYPPSYKEIAAELSISATTVKKHMDELIADGIIETDAEPGTKSVPDPKYKGSEEREKRMNKVMLMGRLTRDPDVRWTQGPEQSAVARYTLAVDRRFQKEGGATADFIGCVAFGRQAEFAEKYLQQGIKIAITGRIQTGSYTNRDGQKVYTTDVVVEEQEFVESKGASAARPPKRKTDPETDADGFMNIPEGVEDEIPFR